MRGVATAAEQSECETEAVHAGADGDVGVADASDRVVTEPPCGVEEDGTPTAMCAL